MQKCSRALPASDRTYGARRVWRDVLELGYACGLHRIERLMRNQALRARPGRRGLPVDRGVRSIIAKGIFAIINAERRTDLVFAVEQRKDKSQSP